MDETFKPDAPVRDAETAPFWDAARAGKLLLKQCDACREIFHHPRLLCPFCLSDSSWIESAGRGIVYSHSTVHNRDGSYILAMVTLAEGPTMMTNILLPDDAKVEIGQAVRVDFIDTKGDERLPVFVPA